MKSRENEKNKSTSLSSVFNSAIFAILTLSLFIIPFGLLEAATSGIVPCNPTFNASDSTGVAALTDNCGWEQLIALGQNILNYAIVLMALLSVVGIAYAGFLYMSSGGDSGKIKKAHGIFTKIIWGMVFVLGAYLIVKTLLAGLGYGQNGFTSILD